MLTLRVYSNWEKQMERVWIKSILTYGELGERIVIFDLPFKSTKMDYFKF